MNEDKETLFEMMLSADRFCSKVESAAQDLPPSQETSELRLKLAQSRTLLREIRNLYDQDRLMIDDAQARGSFRQLIISLMWVAFYARGSMDFKLFRKLVVVESGFTHLLVTR